jgi:voltage-gated potassium channel
MTKSKSSLKKKAHEVIFEADTFAGKLFDEILLVLILLSVVVVMLDSVPYYHDNYKEFLYVSEWIFTIIFTFEYILRIWTTEQSKKYIFSFYGIIDLLSIIPTYASLFILNSHFLIVIRILRLLRVFRVLKLIQFMGASNLLINSFKNSRHKITVFFLFVLLLVTIIGSSMYIIESPEAGFTSIPRSIYWAIVTLTTVGYGDIAPQTTLGQAFASIVMLLGYAIIAVPTGIITADIAMNNKKVNSNTQVCSRCNAGNHADDAVYCKYCGEKL